jgi:hypothetical protein
MLYKKLTKIVTFVFIVTACYLYYKRMLTLFEALTLVNINLLAYGFKRSFDRS